MLYLLALLGQQALHALWNVYAAIRAYGAMARVQREVDPPAEWPQVSIIVPACNEGDTIQAATKAKLASDSPNLEVVLVDDRSTDATSEIIARLAAGDRRVRVVRIDELPSGWIGKVHAMHRGVAAATGDWLLFCDADVHMARTLLRRVIATVETRGLDFAVMMPRIWSGGFALDAAVAALLRLIVVANLAWKVSDPRSRVAVGNGVFNLARASAFANIAGFEWSRLEVLGDQAFAQMMKRAGARCAVLDGSLGEMMRGLEKNGYVRMGQLRPHRLLVAAAVLVYLEVGPAIALAFASTRLAAAFVLVTFSAVQVSTPRQFATGPAAPDLLTPRSGRWARCATL
jgi:glycosyltransferase involved in cell wall biosynthesis